jgi:GT2 family glycosyltransferase
VDALDQHPVAGSAASQVILYDEPGQLDSAGMLIAADGSSKQRGHRQPPARFGQEEEILMPSGSAAIYRQTMLAETGGFDEDFFLYCEDSDLGLRARWAGWTCRYVPSARVRHRYSHSAGRASRLKAYYVERNRLLLIVKNFPLSNLLQAPFATIARYWYHLAALGRGEGAAAQFQLQGQSPLLLAWYVFKAHVAVLAHLPRVLRQRSGIRHSARIKTVQFQRLLHTYSISLKQVASL